MEWISSIWTHKKLIYELESLFIMFLLDAEFFLGTKIFMSSLQGNRLPVSWWLDAMASPKSWGGSPLKIWFGFPNWSSHTHTHIHQERMERFIIPIMKLSGESSTGLSSWSEMSWKNCERRETSFEFLWWLGAEAWSEGFSAWFTLTVGDKAPRLSYQHAQMRDRRGRGRGKA